MAQLGFVLLVVALVAALAATVGLTAGVALASHGAAPARAGRAAALLCAAALLACCVVLAFCFFSDDVSVLYVLQERSRSTDGLAWLYTLSGLWAGRAGSLLFWALLISLFGVAMIAAGRRHEERRLDDAACAIVHLVLLAFLGVLVFSQANTPFVPTPASCFADDGTLTQEASRYGMNQLLEHWAMAIHPPALFVGYAGMTVPFAYAAAALVVGDASRRWVDRASRFLLLSWLFLSAGIGLGAVWAYVVLGWGGYWGWDPVENASLLSWLVGVALIHTFTVYRQRGAFKRWAVMCACLAFAFVIAGTFITRSGIVQSVHAFEGDQVSLALFGVLIVLSVLTGVVGLAFRWETFAPDRAGGDDVENMLSKDAAYYFNNVILIAFTLLLAYMTVSQALPEWLPFGGVSLGAASYDAVARPLGVAYLLMAAVCPLLAWEKTEPERFWRAARVPGICALALFALLMALFLVKLVPACDAALPAEGPAARGLLETGPPLWRHALAIAGLFVASLLFFNSLFMVVRAARRHCEMQHKGTVAGLICFLRYRSSTYGGALAHLSLAIVLVGLVGSSLYAMEKAGYVELDAETETATDPFVVGPYALEYAGQTSCVDVEADTAVHAVSFSVYRDGEFIATVAPNVQHSLATQQQKLNAAVLGFPDEDLFVVYRGMSADGSLSLDVRVNPLMSFVWAGFALFMCAVVAACAGRPAPSIAHAQEGSRP